MRLVLIEWLDSMGCSSEWQRLETTHPAPLVCRSVGWLLHDTDACKVIVPHVTKEHPDASAQGCGDMTIPSASVLRILDLPDPAVISN